MTCTLMLTNDPQVEIFVGLHNVTSCSTNLVGTRVSHLRVVGFLSHVYGPGNKGREIRRRRVLRTRAHERRRNEISRVAVHRATKVRENIHMQV